MSQLYVIGSLRNPQVPLLAEYLRSQDFSVFDDWYAAGPEADDHWQAYETARGRSYGEALQGFAARNVFAFDRGHLERADAVVLLMPAGRSGHLELGWSIGRGKPGFVLFPEEPERFDVMYQFATAVCFSEDELVAALKKAL